MIARLTKNGCHQVGAFMIAEIDWSRGCTENLFSDIAPTVDGVDVIEPRCPWYFDSCSLTFFFKIINHIMLP